MLTRADHARVADLPERLRGRRRALRRPPCAARVPVTAPPGLLNPLTVAAFNELWFRKAPAGAPGQPQTIAGFFHPLDGVGAWNRLYGPGASSSTSSWSPSGRSRPCAGCSTA